MRITLPLLALILLAAALLAMGYWSWAVLHQFEIAAPMWRNLPWLLLHTFQLPELRWIGVQSLLVGLVPAAVALYVIDALSDKSPDRVVRGQRLVTGPELARQTREKHRSADAPAQVHLAGVPIPQPCESTHFLLAGSTGTGKTVAADELLASALARGDRAIVIDPDGYSYARFGQEGDVLLNPFDHRSPGWALFNEVRAPFDYERLAKSVVPDAADVASQVWHGYAQQLLTEILRAMAQAGQSSTAELLHWATQAPASDLATFLAGSAASAQFDPGAEKALASTRFILSNCLAAHQHLKPGDFSLREWLRQGKGNLFLTWRADSIDALRPLMSAWIDILISDLLSWYDVSPRPIWLFLDELASLHRLGSLEQGLTRGRKYGLRVVSALQSTAQLDALYGREEATTLRSCFRSLLALGCSSSDADTPRLISEGLGSIVVERELTTHSQGQSGGQTSHSVQRFTEPLVMPSELTDLAPLKGFLKLSGRYPVARVSLQLQDRPARLKAFEARAC